MNSHSDVVETSLKENNSLYSLLIPSKINILNFLSSAGPTCVCEISDALEISQSLTSHHLSELKENGLVKAKQESKFVIYRTTKKGKKVCSQIIKLAEELNE